MAESIIKAINYWAFPAKPDGSPRDPVEAMRMAKDLGFDAFELTVEAEGRLNLNTTERDAEGIRREAESIGISLITVASGLAWGTSPTDPREEVRRKAVEDYKKILDIASWLGAETILYLPGMVSAVFIPDYVPQRYDLVDKRAKEALKELIPYAEKVGVKIAVENVWNRFLLSPIEMRDFIDYFGSDYVGAYFDVGNVMLYGHPEHWIEILGERIFAVHLKDFKVNVGNLDGFVDLLDGDVNYPAVMGAFRRVGYSGPFTVEFVPGRVGAVEKAAAAIKIIERM